jgi:phosphate uptake regulator
MNTQQNIQILRGQLLAMARLSQRALDESVKGYELRNLDFARHVDKAENDLQEHYRRIKDLRRQIMNCGDTNASDSRFTSAASSIATAFHVTYSAAKEIAQSTIHRLESSGIENCAPLEQLAQGVNRSMRLCVIALFNEDARLARTALRSQEHSVQLYELGVSDFSSVGPQNDFERTVIRELGAIAEQIQEIADALLSWLEGKHMSASEFIRDFGSSSRQVPSAHAGSDTTLYMQSRQNLRPKASQSLLC